MGDSPASTTDVTVLLAPCRFFSQSADRNLLFVVT